MLLVMVACVEEIENLGESTPGADLPGHNDCLPEGEIMSDEICLAVVEEDGRWPTVSYNVSGLDPAPNDPRLADEDYLWLQSELSRCTCRCCHTAGLGGPGVHRWDLAYQPVWIDSAASWSLLVMRGDSSEYEQTLPSSDPDRVWQTIEREIDRRRGDP